MGKKMPSPSQSREMFGGQGAIEQCRAADLAVAIICSQIQERHSISPKRANQGAFSSSLPLRYCLSLAFGLAVISLSPTVE